MRLRSVRSLSAWSGRLEENTVAFMGLGGTISNYCEDYVNSWTAGEFCTNIKQDNRLKVITERQPLW